jgi:hypothetical protein
MIDLDAGDLHGQLKKQVKEWEEALQDTLQRQANDRDYYDGNQWTHEEIRELGGHHVQPHRPQGQLRPRH